MESSGAAPLICEDCDNTMEPHLYRVKWSTIHQRVLCFHCWLFAQERKIVWKDLNEYS